GPEKTREPRPMSEPRSSSSPMDASHPTPYEVEILLVEDNASDVELTLRALKTRNLANRIFIARDGAEAIDLFFGDGSHPLRDIGVVQRVTPFAEEKVDRLGAVAGNE